MSESSTTYRNLLVANQVYPDAASLFSSIPDELDNVKDDCLVVLDTNALLVPYSTGRDSLGQIRKTYLRLKQKNRLVIPGQVAREYARNRASKLVDICTRLSQKLSSTQITPLGRYPLLEDFKGYQTLEEAERRLQKCTDDYRVAITKVIEYVQGWNCSDPVSMMYRDLFDPGVVHDIQVGHDSICEELDDRYSNGIPPGYEDVKKPDRGVGDLLIWKTILDVGKSRKSSVLFVTGDVKRDWCHTAVSQVLCPRHELVDEFRRASDGHHFYLVQFSTFLKLFGASEQVINEVRWKERASRRFHIRSTKLRAFMSERDDDVFVVEKGSQASKEVADSMSQGWLDLRGSLVISGELADHGEYYEFVQDTEFASLSAAASVVLGRQTAGPLYWLDDENRTYKDCKDSSA
jgi:hypothetical protein